jgi:hypothetical protein
MKKLRKRKRKKERVPFAWRAWGGGGVEPNTSGAVGLARFQSSPYI